MVTITKPGDPTTRYPGQLPGKWAHDRNWLPPKMESEMMDSVLQINYSQTVEDGCAA